MNDTVNSKRAVDVNIVTKNDVTKSTFYCRYFEELTLLEFNILFEIIGG